MVIEGSSFDSEYVEEVTFGGSPVSYAVESDSRITAIAPPGSGEVPVTVTTAAGSATAPEQFAYRGHPHWEGREVRHQDGEHGHREPADRADGQCVW